MKTFAKIRWLGIALLVAAGHASAQKSQIARIHPLPDDVTPRVARQQCGGFKGHFGPFDFRTVHPDDRHNVEMNHLEMEMATFLSGRVFGRNSAGTGPVVGGFIYTLKSMPNHPVALLMIEQLGFKLKSESPQNADLPLECFYVRAFLVAPDDPVVRALYGIYLSKRDRREEAVRNLDIGDAGVPFSGALQYQIGLANLALKRYDKAQLNAMRAARAGFPLDALSKSIRDARKWDDGLQIPEPQPDAAQGAASAASSSAP